MGMSRDTFYRYQQAVEQGGVEALLNQTRRVMYYNHHRTHQGKMCCGRTPMATLLDGKGIWAEKNLSSN